MKLKEKSEWKHLFQSNPVAFSAALRAADGRIGKLEQKKEDKDALLSQSKAKELIKLLYGGQYLPLLLYCNKAAESRPQLDALLQKACHGLRDALAVRKSTQIPLLFFATVADAEEAAEHLSDRSILALITEIKKIQNDLAGNPNLKGTLAMLADTLFRAAQN